MRNGCVYILQSLRNKSYYIGSTNGLDNRIKEHNSGKSPYTRNNLPFIIVFKQEFDSLKEARQLEYRLKKHASRDIIEKIIKEKIIKLKIK